jgi:hypothetical protein
MTVRVFLLSVVAGLLAGLAGGCVAPSAETGRNKNPPIVMELAPDVSQAVATVRIGDEVRFVLPAARGPAYVWQIITNDPRCLRQSSGVVYQPGVGGAPGTSSVAFIAQRPSRSFLRFAYVPAGGSKEAELADAYVIVVTVRP